MKMLEVFDPAMCYSLGICGVVVDHVGGWFMFL